MARALALPRSYDKAWKTRRPRRHRILQAILVPTAHRLMRYRAMHYELPPR